MINLLQVYAVEACQMARHAAAVVQRNGLCERIEVIQSKAEELDLPEKVDLIISEWMGTLLLVSGCGSAAAG